MPSPPERIESLKLSLAASKKKGEAGLQLQNALLACLAPSPVGASENSPWRKPWVRAETSPAPSGAEDPFAIDTTCPNPSRERKRAVSAEGTSSPGLRPGTPPPFVWKSRPNFEIALDAALEANGVRIPVPLRKAVLSALCDRDETAEICLDPDGHPEPDPDLRDTENVFLKEDIHNYFDREVKPHVPDAWIDESKTKIGYEIPFTRHFYKYVPPRPLEEIEAEIRQLESEIMKALAAVGR